MKTDSPSPDRKKRARERWIVLGVFSLVLIFGFLEGWFFTMQPSLPMAGNILLFALINLNVILLLLLVYLVLRNIVKLIFERKRNMLGHRLRTRLVLAFVGLTLIPTIPLFWIATQFIFSSLDHWFSHQVENSLEQSVALSRNYLEEVGEDLILDAQGLREAMLDARQQGELTAAQFASWNPRALQRHHVDAVILVNSSRDILSKTHTSRFTEKDALTLLELNWEKRHTNGSVRSHTLDRGRESLIVRMPFPSLSQDNDLLHNTLLVVRVLPAAISERLEAISTGYEDYLQLKLLHNPLKRSNFIAFCIITLLVIFAAVWFGFFLAKGITHPIQSLVWATRRVADGNMDVELKSDRRDEIGMLMNSFNEMVRDLKESRTQLDQAYSQLQQHHAELEERRRYMEIILKNVAAGVVSVDAQGRIVTMNKSAEALFGLTAEETRDQPYEKLLESHHLEIVRSFKNHHQSHRHNYLEQQVNTTLGRGPVVLQIKATLLHDEKNRYIGTVVVLDDLTDLEKAQRMAAWREVARRIAHEIKNPLTPIRLCAQRLSRRYKDNIGADDPVFWECTGTIIEQVDRMKYLVDEFSKFARMPRIQLTPCDLGSLVGECLTLYRHSHPHIRFSVEVEGKPPRLQLDKDQIMQALINLVENAIHAIDGQEGTIHFHITHAPRRKMVLLECADSGRGLSHQDKLRMFEPYYSNKEKGTGLGLAIVASIIEDHHGFVRVRDNEPRGTVIVMELPEQIPTTGEQHDGASCASHGDHKA